jgi:hypothetical protein
VDTEFWFITTDASLQQFLPFTDLPIQWYTKTLLTFWNFKRKDKASNPEITQYDSREQREGGPE